MLTKCETLPTAFPEPWRDEFYHTDGSHQRLLKEKGAAGQHRLALHYANALTYSPLDSARAVAEKLRSCAPHQRCGSGICPPCTWATGRWLRKAAASFAETTTQMLFSTVQLPDSRALPSFLDKIDMDEQKELLADAINMAGLGRALVFGAADFSRNVWTADKTKRWSVHWALYSPDRDRAVFTAALTSVIPDHALVQVPVKTKIIKRTPDKAFSYGFKNVFDRKQIPRSDDERKRSPIIRPGDEEFDHLAVNLDRIGIMNRFFFQGCSIAGRMIVPN